jgi:hypothetical protein
MNIREARGNLLAAVRELETLQRYTEANGKAMRELAQRINDIVAYEMVRADKGQLRGPYSREREW